MGALWRGPQRADGRRHPPRRLAAFRSALSPRAAAAALLFICAVAISLDVRADPLDIVGGGARHSFQVEVAATPDVRRVGLMYRRQMAPDAGMLFDFGGAEEVTMWMMNTYIPLDMLFIRADGVIHRIESDTVPFSTDTIGSKGPVRFVLELNAGTARRLGIKPGDKVAHPIISAD